MQGTSKAPSKLFIYILKCNEKETSSIYIERATMMAIKEGSLSQSVKSNLRYWSNSGDREQWYLKGKAI